WRLEKQAIFFWEHALADHALIRLQTQAQGDVVKSRATELRTRLTALKLVRASPREMEQLLAAYSQHGPADGLVPLSEALETIGAYPRSIAIYRGLWQRDPSNPPALRNLLSAGRLGNDLQTLEVVLTRCVKEGFFRSNDAAQRDLALQLVELLEKR